MPNRCCVGGYEGLLERQAGLPPYLNVTRRLRESLERLVRLYEAWGRPVQAAEWKNKLPDSEQAPDMGTRKDQSL